MILNRFGSWKYVSSLLAGKNLTQKAYLNAMAEGLDYAARVIVGFIVTPFLVAGLGDSLYGIWRAVGSLTGYITAASGRPSQTLKYTLANLQSSVDYEEKRRQVATAVVVWLLFSPLLTAVGAVVTWYAPIWIKGVPPELYWVVRVATGILVAEMVLTTLVYLPQSILEGENLGYTRMGLSAMLVVLDGTLTILALYLHTGLVGVAVASLIIILLRGLLYYFVVRNNISWFGMSKPSREAVKSFFSLSWWFLAWRLVSQAMMASDLVILGIFASGELVTRYSLTKYAPETLINLVAIVVFGSTPGLGGIIGKKDFGKAARIRSEIMILTWLVCTSIGVTILLWNHSLIRLWVGDQRYAGSWPNLLILVSVCQFVLIRSDANIIDLTLDLTQKVLIGLLSAAISVIASAALIKFFDLGIIGLVLGVMLGRSILSFVYPIMIGRFLGIGFSSQWKGVIQPIFISAVLFLGATWLENMAFMQRTTQHVSWIGLAPLVGITALIAAALAFGTGLNGRQQGLIINRVRAALDLAER
ncbi:MAG: hypothetical protein U0175_27125 [Caldilineaceae bacterium]